MEHTHTPEPWKKAKGQLIVGGEKEFILCKVYGGVFSREGNNDYEANGPRIVACVNACAGIPTEVLEMAPAGWIGKKMELSGKAMADFEMLKIENERLRKTAITNLRTIENLFQVVESLKTQIETGYTPTKQNCKGCFGPCGVCREKPVNDVVLQALIEVTNALQDASGLTDNEGSDYTQEYAPVIEEARRVIEQAKDTYFPGLFIGTPTGIEDIEEHPDEPDYDNQAKDYDNDQYWDRTPTEYD